MNRIAVPDHVVLRFQVGEVANKMTNPRRLGVQDPIFYGRVSLNCYSFKTVLYYHGVNCRERRVERCLINGLLRRGRPILRQPAVEHPTYSNFETE
jgi:hypothetical protein